MMTATAETIRPPSKALLLLEGRALGELGAYYAARPLLRRAPRGDGHPVLVLPGLGGSNRSTAPLRAFLKDRGYAAQGWSQGRNLGPHPGLIERLLRDIRQQCAQHGGRISLVGWSLGGLYARELAKMAPDDVRQVVTLGSPFTGPPKASNSWRAYEFFSGQKAGEARSQRDLKQTPPMPTTSIFSRSDGIVAWQCCLEREGPQTENIRVEGSHCGLGHNPLVLYAIADRLAQPEGQWTPFRRDGLRRMFYADPQRGRA